MHISHKRTHTLTALLILGLLLSAFAMKPGIASLTTNNTNNRSDSSAPSLKSLLNPDGSLNLSSGFNGSLDANGYRMSLGSNGAPRFVPTALAAPGDENWDSQFAGTGPNDYITAMAVSGTDVYIGGYFTAIGGVSANFIARWDITTQTWSALGSGAGPDGNGVGGTYIFTVTSIAANANDVYVGGSFGSVHNNNGQSLSVRNIARWNKSANTWSDLGAGVNNIVTSVAVNGNDVYVGGDFDTAYNSISSSVSVNYIARWDKTTNTWSALGSNAGPTGNGMNSGVNAMAVSGNYIYVGGYFTTAYNSNSSSVSANRIVRWDTTTGAWSALGGDSGATGNGLNSHVLAIAVSGSDVYVSGEFDTAYSSSVSSVSANKIARWNGSVWTPMGGGMSHAVNDIAVVGGNVYAGGVFDIAYNSSSAINAVGIAKWDGFNWSLLGSDGINGGNGVGNGSVFALDVNGSDLYVGGSFTTANNSSSDRLIADRVAKWSVSTNSWSALGDGEPVGKGTDNPVQAVLVNGSDVYIGGYFNRVGNLRANGVAKWNNLTNTWSTLGSGNGFSGNGVGNEGFFSLRRVFALALIGSDLYVAGEFDMVYNSNSSSVSARNIARWNTATGVWSALGDGVNSLVLALAVSGSDLYVGGVFDTVGAGVSANRVARWKTTDNTWSALGGDSGPTGNGVDHNGGYCGVGALAASGNYIYAGGSCNMARNSNSSGVSANYIARWDKTTNTWSALGSDSGPTGNGLSPGYNGTVITIAVNGNDVYVGGDFNTAYNSNSSSVKASNIAKWDGNSWSVLGGNSSDSGGNGSGGHCFNIAVIGNEVYVGGNFVTANNNVGDYVAVNGIAKWNGSTWSPLGSGVGTFLNQLTAAEGVYVIGSNATHLFIGGKFDTAGGKLSANFGRYQLSAANCSVKIAPPQRTVPRNGASGHVNVNAQGNCSWTAVSNVLWITITSGSSGSGDGRVNYTVAANASGSQRIGTITISGQTFTVRQL